MRFAARITGAAAFPIVGWAAVSHPQPFSTVPGAALIVLAVAGFIVAGRNTLPWSLAGGALCVLWAALVVAWWAPGWVPHAVALVLLGAACVLWLVPFVWSIPWRREPDDDELDDEVPEKPRLIVVRDAGESGIDVGGIDTAFDYDGDEPAPRHPPQGWEPRAMVTGADPVSGIFTDDEPADGDAPLLDRLVVAWPSKANGDPRGSVHLVDLASLLDVAEEDLSAALTDAGVQVEPVSARPLAGGGATRKSGVKWPSLQAAGLATGVATP